MGFLKVTGRREQGDTAQVGKTYPKTPVSERSERIGGFPGPSGHGPATRRSARIHKYCREHCAFLTNFNSL